MYFFYDKTYYTIIKKATAFPRSV